MILQDFVQTGGQDRVLAFCKSFIISSLLFFVKGFESPWGYSIMELPGLNVQAGYNHFKYHSVVNNPLDTASEFSLLEFCEMAEQI